MIEIPPDWQLTPLGEEFEIQQGKSLSPISRRGENPRPFLRTSNVLWGRIDLSTVDQMDFTDEEFSRLSLVDGDLLVCEGGDIGRAAVYRGPSGQYAYQNHLHRLRAKTDEIIPDFVVHWLRAAFTQLGLYEGIGNKTTIPKLQIPKPDPEEQKQVAGILGHLQRAIEVETAICEKLAVLKSATMAKLFREGLHGEPLKQTEIGEIPESWEVVRLGDLALIERGKFAHRPRNDPRFYGGKIPFIQTGDVARARGRLGAYTQTLNDLGLNVSRVFPRGTIVITIAANIGDTAILDIDAAFPDSIIGITPTAAVDAQYLEFFLRTQKEKMNQLAPKGTQKNINIEFLRPWPIALPSTLDEQLRIADVLRTIEQRELRSRTSVSKLNELFSCLLHQLMTGAIRVKNLDLAGVSHA
jgi:type I restriction enzyme S subunit